MSNNGGGRVFGIDDEGCTEKKEMASILHFFPPHHSSAGASVCALTQKDVYWLFYQKKNQV